MWSMRHPSNLHQIHIRRHTRCQKNVCYVAHMHVAASDGQLGWWMDRIASSTWKIGVKGLDHVNRTSIGASKSVVKVSSMSPSWAHIIVYDRGRLEHVVYIVYWRCKLKQESWSEAVRRIKKRSAEGGSSERNQKNQPPPPISASVVHDGPLSSFWSFQQRGRKPSHNLLETVRLWYAAKDEVCTFGFFCYSRIRVRSWVLFLASQSQRQRYFWIHG